MKTLILLLFPIIAGLALADEPTNLPFVTGLPGSLQHSVVVDDHAYCSTSAGLLVLDVSDPTHVTQVSMLPLPGWGRTITVDGGYAYLLVWDVGLVVINIGDPATPWVVATRPETVRPSGIVVSGHHAFISDMGLGLCVVDILDPAQPQLVATHPLPGELRKLDVEDDVAYVAADYSDLHILDVSTPSSPTLMTSFSLPGHVRDVVVRNSLAYLACGDYGLRVLSVINPTDPMEIAQLDMLYDLGYPRWTSSLSLNGNFAFMGITHNGLGLVDITNPADPKELAWHEIRGTTTATTILNDLAYVSAAHGGMVVVDINDPSAPFTVDQFWLLGTVADLEVADGKLWVAGGYSPTDEKSLRNHDAGLFVVDMPELSSARVIGYGSTGLEPRHLALSGHHAYLSTPFGGIRIQDISDPTTPVEVGSIPNTAEGYAHDVTGDHVYTFLGGRFVVMDVSDPSQPVEAGGCEMGFYGHLTADGSVVYNTIGHRGLQVFNVDDPNQPTAMGWLDMRPNVGESAVLDDHLYVTNGLTGLTVVNVSDPSQPVLVGACDLPGFSTSVACSWPYAYVVAMGILDDPSGVMVVDISNPVAPVHVAGSDLPMEARSVAVDGSLVYVGSHQDGVLVFRHDTTSGVMVPLPSVRLGNHPNPFNPRTLITFEAPSSTHVTVSVFDVTGRLVCTLVDEMKTAGVHEVTWGGLDDRGFRVATGVYFSRMTTAGQAVTRKMLLLK